MAVLGLVHDDEDAEFGMVGGEEANKGGEEFLDVLAMLDFLGGAGLAGDGVMVEAALDSGAIAGDDSFEGADHVGNGFGACDLADGLGVVLDDETAGGVFEAGDEHGAHEEAVVGDGGHGEGHLQRGDGDALAHRDLGNGDLGPILEGMDHAGDFARQGKAGALAEAEVADVLPELLLAEADADLGRTDIGGLGDDVLDGEEAEGM